VHVIRNAKKKRSFKVSRMPGKKRASEGQSTTRKAKKQKLGDVANDSLLLSTEVDFPRGGGTTFTPLEVKAIRSEAIKEADDDLFEVCVNLIASVPN
jgi:rRNA biogenesis protein RRP5